MAVTTPIRPPRSKKKHTKSEDIPTTTPPAPSDIDAATPEPAPEDSAAEPTAKKKGGKPTDPANPPFFQKVAAVPQSDWGTRAFMYVYCTEPICNLKMLGENKYLFRSSKPIHDVQEIMEDYGSMKGYITLNLRKTGTDATDERDRYHFEIYNPKYPPKIPRRAWLSDPRNERWAALLPKEVEPNSNAAGSLLDGIKVYKEIRDEVRDEIDPGAVEEPGDRTRDTLETMKLAKDLFGTPATTVPTESPLKVAVELFTLMNTMKAENPAIELYRKEMESIRAELKAEREATRKPAAPAGNWLEQVTAFIPVWTQLEPFAKRLLGVNGTTAVSTAVEAGRPAKMGTLDFLAEVLPKVFESPIANAIAHKVMQSVDGQQQQRPGMNGQQPPQPQPQIQQQQRPRGTDLELFIQVAGTAAMMEHFLAGEPGSSFAEWVWFSRPDLLPQLQNFKHAMMPNVQAGLESIVQGYKNTETVWPDILKRGEPEFRKFIGEFCSWTEPKEDEGPEPANEDEDGWAPPTAQQTQGDSARGERVS